MTTRRSFIQTVPLAACSLLAARTAHAQSVSETDAQAAALGYKADTTKVDAAKWPKHAAGQSCAGCALYQGKAGDAEGPCPLFPGKKVAAKGWCSAWAKKA